MLPRHPSFFDIEQQLDKIDQTNDFLPKLKQLIDWEMFRGDLNKVREKERLSNAGANLNRVKYEFFESDEYASVRAVLNNAPKNDGLPEELDMVLERIDRFVPAMNQLIDSFLYPSPVQ